MVAFAVLLALLAVASITDIRAHRIPNTITYSGMLIALAGNGVGDLWLVAGGSGAEALEWLGHVGLVPSLLGLLVCGLVMLVCYVFLHVGGGDVKLLAMMGAFLGPEKGIEAMLWTFVLGACAAIIILVWRVGAWRLFVRVLRQAGYTLRLGRWPGLTPEERAQLQPPLFLAPAALAAVVVMLVLPA